MVIDGDGCTVACAVGGETVDIALEVAEHFVAECIHVAALVLAALEAQAALTWATFGE